MLKEIEIASQYIASFLPEREQYSFCQELKEILIIKFNQHWYPSQPQRGSAFRSIKIHQKLDSVLQQLSHYSLDNLPSELVIWIDPNSVSYRKGTNYVVTLWEPSPELRKAVTISPPLSPPHNDATRFPLQPIVA